MLNKDVEYYILEYSRRGSIVYMSQLEGSELTCYFNLM